MYYLCISTITWIKNNFIVFTESTLTPIQSELKSLTAYKRNNVFKYFKLVEVSTYLCILILSYLNEDTFPESKRRHFTSSHVISYFAIMVNWKNQHSLYLEFSYRNS